jgi:hypothetical protein
MEITTHTTAPVAEPAEVANYWSHLWDYEYERCSECDCRPWGRWSNLPCGAAWE